MPSAIRVAREEAEQRLQKHGGGFIIVAKSSGLPVAHDDKEKAVPTSAATSVPPVATAQSSNQPNDDATHWRRKCEALQQRFDVVTEERDGLRFRVDELSSVIASQLPNGNGGGSDGVATSSNTALPTVGAEEVALGAVARQGIPSHRGGATAPEPTRRVEGGGNGEEDRLRTKCKELRQRIDQLTKEREGVTKERDTLQHRVDELTGNAADLKARCETSVVRLAKERKAVLQERGTLQKRIDELTGIVADLKERSETRVEQVTKELEGVTKERDTLHNRVNELTSDFVDLKARCEISVDRVTKEREGVTKERDTLQNRVDELTGIVAELKARCKTMAAVVSEPVAMAATTEAAGSSSLLPQISTIFPSGSEAKGGRVKSKVRKKAAVSEDSSEAHHRPKNGGKGGSAGDRLWRARLEQLRLHKVRTGSVNGVFDKALLQWMKDQRIELLKLQQEQPSTMTFERMSALDALGFDEFEQPTSRKREREQPAAQSMKQNIEINAWDRGREQPAAQSKKQKLEIDAWDFNSFQF